MVVVIVIASVSAQDHTFATFMLFVYIRKVILPLNKPLQQSLEISMKMFGLNHRLT